MGHLSDKEILSMWDKGLEDEAFEAIVSNYSERLYFYIRRLCCSHEDSDDLLQEVFIKAWKALPRFRADCSLYTWLYRIATNESLNYLKKNRLRAILRGDGLEQLLEKTIDDDPYFNGDALQREVQKAINSLPDRQKQVFILRYFDELPYEEISTICGTGIGSLKASYHHACKKVRERLEKQF